MMQINKIIGTSVGADDAHEYIDLGIRRSDNPVMLSTFALLRVNSAKHLAAQRDRPFAALRVTVEGPMMRFNYFIGIAKNPPRADQSAVCTINRHLRMSRLFY